MAFPDPVQSTVTVTAAATLLATPPTWERYTLSVLPASGTVYVGGADVTTTGSTKGRPVPTGEELTLTLRPGGKAYAIAGSSVEVSVVILPGS